MFYNPFKKIRELEAKNLELDAALFDSQQFERIAGDKLTVWVAKHDALLVHCKTNHDQSQFNA
jgi:hypothetical protein